MPGACSFMKGDRKPLASGKGSPGQFYGAGPQLMSGSLGHLWQITAGKPFTPVFPERRQEGPHPRPQLVTRCRVLNAGVC